jgi:spore coat polysaccharide biosynthesis protein SpsF
VHSAQARFALAVATTRDRADDRIAELCGAIGVDCYRGHATDLLDRHYRAAAERGAQAVVKIPSDCPLIDPAVIDRVLETWTRSNGQLDYLSNLHPQSYPDGNDVEVMSLGALAIAWNEARRPFEREHTTPFLWERPERFRIGNVVSDRGDDLSRSHRLTLDYPEDYRLIAAIFDALHPKLGPAFSLGAILELLDENPDLLALNARYRGVNWYRHHLDELRTIRPDETRLPEAAA